MSLTALNLCALGAASAAVAVTMFLFGGRLSFALFLFAALTGFLIHLEWRYKLRQHMKSLLERRSLSS